MIVVLEKEGFLYRIKRYIFVLGKENLIVKWEELEAKYEKKNTKVKRWKGFLKPTKGKITLAIILFIWFLFGWTEYPQILSNPIVRYLAITSNLMLRAIFLLPLPRVLILTIYHGLYPYFLSCCIFWVYDKFFKKFFIKNELKEFLIIFLIFFGVLTFWGSILGPILVVIFVVTLFYKLYIYAKKKK